MGLPSSFSSEPYLTINVTAKNTDLVTSICLDTDKWTISEHGIFKLKDISMFSNLVKNVLGYPIKMRLLFQSTTGCLPHLQRLPRPAYDKIFRYLSVNEQRKLEGILWPVKRKVSSTFILIEVGGMVPENLSSLSLR